MKKLLLHIFTKFIFVSILLLTDTTLYAASPAIKTSDEALFKAAFIYNFAKFTTWPESSFLSNSPLVLCIIDNQKNEFDLTLLKGKVIKGRQVSIKSKKTNQSIDDCHMLYISKSVSSHYRNILKSVRGKALLTVSDIPDFVDHGGIIQFYRKKGQTRLIINLNTARNANLEISSRLLILAEVINTKVNP